MVPIPDLATHPVASSYFTETRNIKCIAPETQMPRFCKLGESYVALFSTEGPGHTVLLSCGSELIQFRAQALARDCIHMCPPPDSTESARWYEVANCD